MVGGSQWASSHRSASQHEAAKKDWKGAHVPFTRTGSNPSTDQNPKAIPIFHDCSFAFIYLALNLNFCVFLLCLSTFDRLMWVFETTSNPLLCSKSDQTRQKGIDKPPKNILGWFINHLSIDPFTAIVMTKMCALVGNGSGVLPSYPDEFASFKHWIKTVTNINMSG